MRPNRPTDRASTEIQVLLAAAVVLVSVTAYAALKRLMYGFFTNPTASTEQVTNVANGIGNAASAAPALVAAVLVLVTIGARALE